MGIQEVVDADHWWARGRSAALAKLLSRVVPHGGPCLDVGGGTGVWALKIEDAYGPVSAVEPNIDLYRSQLSQAVDGRIVVCGLPGPLPFRNNSFKLVSCLDVIEHVEDDRAAARELARVVAPDGHLLLTVPAHPHLWSKLDETVGHKRRYTRGSLLAIANETGLSVRLVAPLNVWLYPAAAVARRLNLIGGGRPPPAINKALAKVFESEGNLAQLWPRFVRGLSWVCLAQKA